jgi:hypothetical protein
MTFPCRVVRRIDHRPFRDLRPRQESGLRKAAQGPAAGLRSRPPASMTVTCKAMQRRTTGTIAPRDDAHAQVAGASGNIDGLRVQ